MSKQFLAIISVLIVGFIGLVLFSDQSKPSTDANVEPTSHIKGPGTAKVTLVEYADFECSACLQYYPTLKQVTDEYGDKIDFQFRHFPITSIHQNALSSSRAAEAAGLQGKFFEMHDLLYEDRSWVNNSVPTEIYQNFASKLNLDVTKFKTDFASPSVNNVINADMAAGQELGVAGAPTYFINGKKIDINNTLEDFRRVIDAELNKQ